MQFLKHTLTICAAFILLLASCSKDNPAPSTKGILTQGTWKVAYFSDNGAVETNNYSGYVFKFESNGSISVVRGGVSTTGTWNTAGDESNNKLVLNFGSLALIELNEDWVFTEKSESSVTLEHVSGGNGGTDVLILQKL